MRLVDVFSPTTDEEVLAIVALLERREVPCFVHTTRVSSPSSAVQVRARKPRTIMVPAERSAEAVKLISQLRAPCGAHGAAPRRPSSRRLRILFDLLIGGWFVPRGGAPDKRQVTCTVIDAAGNSRGLFGSPQGE